ncbi:hypothetical protein ABZ468_44610 [Streptomyces sp. NPDC005708]|uniref:hypothetical protein n=1 Tax=unclassified Streptomyces TaxID=2593676 RepID=UPI0033FA7421
MSTTPTPPPAARVKARTAACLLLAGGTAFLIGGGLHPRVDAPDGGAKERLRVMFEDGGWYPSQALMLAGTALIAAALIALVRRRLPTETPWARHATTVAALGAILASLALLLHLLAAGEADRLASGGNTPITDTLVVVDTIAMPVFGLGIAALALAGALTRTLGNMVAAIPGVIGGLGYALAAGTILISDRLDGLFPTAIGIALWAAAAGVQQLLPDRRATATA